LLVRGRKRTRSSRKIEAGDGEGLDKTAVGEDHLMVDEVEVAPGCQSKVRL